MLYGVLSNSSYSLHTKLRFHVVLIIMIVFDKDFCAALVPIVEISSTFC